jgi:thiol-disulfide isomerase/thioredoxin
MNTSQLNPGSRRHFLQSLIGLGATALTTNSLFAGVKIGDPLPDLSTLGLEGSIPDIRDKVVHLDFWASWCVPCKQSFPILDVLHKSYASKGYLLIGICMDEKKADMDRFLKRNPISFPILRDAQEKLANQLKPLGMPTSYFVAPDGRLHSVHPKFEGDTTRRAYIAIIEDLLKSVKI